ncbi:MAG: 2OG-Fe(II) oxygenase [Candidatus Binatia bacterium]
MTEHVFSKPPAHGRVASWLGPEMVRRLLDFARTNRDGFRPSTVWDAIGREKKLDLTCRRSYKAKFFGELREELQAAARAALPEMCRQLGSGQFEPSEFEIEMVAHGDGAFFAEHLDRSMGPELGRRLISAVYYFHRMPKSFSGGVLRIYPLAGRKKSQAFAEIEPMNDTLVFFPSWFPHEVLPVKCPSGKFEDSRFAINCWIHC